MSHLSQVSEIVSHAHPAESIVGVVMPSSLTESFEVALARIVDLQQTGAAVQAIVCDGAVRGCVANPLSLSATCTHCREVRSTALSTVANGVQTVSLDSLYTRAREAPLDDAECRELALGVDSTILTFYRSDLKSSHGHPLRSALYRTLSRRYYAHSEFIYAAVRRLLAERVFHRIEFFNGRIVPTRAVMLASKQAGCDFGVIEVSGHDRKLTVARNSSVHDLEFKREELRQFILGGHVDREVGIAFYESRRKGLETNDRSFTRHQQQGLLQPSARPVIAIFTSSADELTVAGPQWFTQASRDPVGFIQALSALLRDRYEIVVRMHPNQHGDKTGATAAMRRALSAVPELRLITPQSKESTYELIDRAVAVVTFGSTVGLEATYWGKPSILVGRAVWDQAGVAHIASTAEQVAALVDTSPTPKSKETAIAVGSYYQKGCGEAGSLSWRPKGTPGFAVKGRSFLAAKRSSAAYWVNRVADRVLRNF